MRECYLYKKLKNNQVKCNVCHHCCIVNNGEYGNCGIRKNENGKFVSLVYGRAGVLNIDPIEKKPFFHFFPGSLSLSFGTFGCNFACAFCQNWTLSQPPKEKFFWHDVNLGNDMLPAKIVTEAIKQECNSIAYTYNEPTVFLEYAIDTMKMAHEANIKNVWVSNGYMTTEALDLILPYLDAINIDLKSFSDDFYNRLCGASIKPILENLKTISQSSAWLEITTLLIPDQNDFDKEIKNIANFIADELGKEVPWHISAFHPEYKMLDTPATKSSKIEHAVRLGKQMGLKYVYAGNVTGSSHENTYCPYCRTIVIERKGYIVRRFDKKGHCPKCGAKINGIFEQTLAS